MSSSGIVVLRSYEYEKNMYIIRTMYNIHYYTYVLNARRPRSYRRYGNFYTRIEDWRTSVELFKFQ